MEIKIRQDDIDINPLMIKEHWNTLRKKLENETTEPQIISNI